MTSPSIRLRAGMAWLLHPSRRRWTLVGAAGAVALALLATSLLWPRGEVELTDRVARAVVRPDPVPTGPIVTSIPPDCGLSAATIDRLVGPAQGEETNENPDGQQCLWDAEFLSFDGTDGAELEIDVAKAHELTQARRRLRATVDAFERKLEFETGSSGSRTSTGDVRPVEGLGAEAVSWRKSVASNVSSGDSFTYVLFRQGNLLAMVKYGGGGKALKEEYTRARALAVAAEVARSMKLTVTGTPKVVEAGDRTVESVPSACDLLPAGVVKEFAGDGATAENGDGYLFEDEQLAKGGGCEWGYELTAAVESAKTSSKGTGEQVAARKYLQLYLAARSAEPESDAEDAETYTVPLRGLGDEAFATYERDTSSKGKVVFRVRDALVRVEVRDLSAQDLNRRDALDGAYRTALAAARNVKPSE